MAKQKVSQKMIVVIGVSFFIWLTDQLTKFVAREYFWAQLNQGGVFGVAQGFQWSLLVAVAILGMCWYVFRKDLNQIELIGWSIVLSAGSSNLLDRMIWSGVWDWIVYPVVNVVGNLADVYLAVGFVVIVLHKQILTYWKLKIKN
jgi:lipoprotein signal peptidase